MPLLHLVLGLLAVVPDEMGDEVTVRAFLDAEIAVLEKRPQAALEVRGKEDERVNLVTGVYLFDAERRDGHVFASHIKERIRSLGPTVRTDLGKQAEGKGGQFAAVLHGV